MTKIPLSYKIIKNCNVSCLENDKSIINTKADYFIEEMIPTTTDDDQEQNEENAINMDDIREELRKEFFREMEEIKGNIIQKAREESKQLEIKAKEQGFDAGFKEGYNQGIREAQNEAAIIKKNAITLIEQANRYVSEYFLENRAHIIQLAADMAESIVHSTIDTSSENIVMLIKTILQKFGKHENIIITCHPDNIDYIKANLHPMELICPDTKFVLIEDRNLEKNGCLVENEHQIIDLQIKKQIEAMLEEIKNLG